MDTKLKSLEILSYLKAQAEKNGISHQQIADATGFERSNVSRVLLAKYPPRMDVLLKIADAIGFDIAVVKQFKGANTGTEPHGQAFLFSVDPIKNELFILHRNFPSCLVQITQDLPSRFILIELYDDMENPGDVLNMPWIKDAIDFYKKYAGGLMSGN